MGGNKGERKKEEGRGWGGGMGHLAAVGGR